MSGLIDGAEAVLGVAAPEVALPLKAGGFALHHLGLIVGGLGCLVLGFMLMLAKADARHWHKVADRQATQLAFAGAALTAQNKAVAGMKAEADRKQLETDRLRKAARVRGDAQRGQADKLDQPRQPTGHCATGTDVLEVKL